jgi:class 3 adenylate cyclase
VLNSAPQTVASFVCFLSVAAMAEERVERRLTAILAADVAGYSRLMAADEEGTLAALKTLRREVADPKIKEHRGRHCQLNGVEVSFRSPLG